VYCPKVVSGIGTFPPTITDRAICISMQRRKKTDSIEKFFIRAVTPEAAALKKRAVGFACENCEEIEVAYEQVALDFLGDRDADSWSPLFAILAVADPARLPELQDCAEHLTAEKTDIATDDSVHLRLLADMRDVWPESEPYLFSKDLTARLRDIEDGSWGEREIDLTQRKLARMLRGFKLRSSTVRIGDNTAKGYSREEFEEASIPYLKLDTSQASRPA
jgi:putative DNA primase/helicase